jgi:hypothetical protein
MLNNFWTHGVPYGHGSIQVTILLAFPHTTGILPILN